MEFYGKILSISAIEEVGQKATKKLTFVLEEDSAKEFKNSLAIDLFGDKVDLIKDSKVGHYVTAHINTRANEHNGRIYNNISAWKVEIKSDSNANTEKPF